jgi:hypothetical protein
VIDNPVKSRPEAQPKIATPDVEQPLPGALEEDAPALRGSDEKGEERAASANLTLTMQYRGLEQTVPLRLPNDAIAVLALEAEAREISLGQLVGTLIEAAMAKGLSQVLDNESSGEPLK